MNGYERTCKFVMGEPVDHPPFMPLVIEWVSRQCGLEYPDFIYHRRCAACRHASRVCAVYVPAKDDPPARRRGAASAL